MSAIFGIINKSGALVDKALADKMQTSLLPRAVDGKNIYHNGNIMFGHHKLIVHSRQTNEQQPLDYNDCIITSDARIDNIEELTKELELTSSTNITDSFIILNAYKKWGNDCVNHLEGEFAFAIWNKLTKTFYGASDHIGFRTFYYYENAEIFAFASEIKAIESIKTEPLEINKESFFDYFTNIHHPITYDKNIHVLQSAHYLLLTENSRVKIKRYWLAKARGKYKFKHSKQWQASVLEIITKKINSEIDSEYPIGIMLSGGLDSSFVAAILCTLLKEKNRKLIAFSTVLPEGYVGNDKDERFYIDKLKQQYDNLEVHYLSIPEEIGPYSNLKEVFNNIESAPNAFHYVEANLFNAAKKLNVRTLFTGLGGDITISHPGGVVIYQYITQLKLAKACKLFIKRYREAKQPLIYQTKKEILNHISLYRILRSYLKKNDYYIHIPLKKNYVKRIIREEDTRNRMYSKSFAMGLNNGELASSLLRFRKHANAFQIEILSPIFSKEIAELFMDIPGEELFLNGTRRSLIKRAMGKLVPKEIINRTDKMPFSPDYNKRITQIKKEYLAKLYKDKKPIEETVGVDFDKLNKLISNIDYSKINTELEINKELFYIPFTIIAAEFYKWTMGKLS